ncbi:GFA family protein [Chelativorans salis]|uniref:GFA family protein n=1 Tax=Chelativorans salis TaxID=2978478 RepID=A0ABT2LN23_9HYPH|nr:GFA family protein [Chelativorans sp. EGI FJ00035]MCT7375966.1 GFA family protein [Chelativorans sp. EGI FJ00035]
MNTEPITGGCQCGAVRYTLHREPHNPHICHCRMCQKAFGSYFAPLASVEMDDFEVTRGALAIFRSSGLVERGFCRDCGTPLTYRFVEGPGRISVALGSLDHPERVKPARQAGSEGRMPWFAELAGLESTASEETDPPELLAQIRRTSRQHPDHDTEEWPPETLE